MRSSDLTKEMLAVLDCVHTSAYIRRLNGDLEYADMEQKAIEAKLAMPMLTSVEQYEALVHSVNNSSWAIQQEHIKDKIKEAQDSFLAKEYPHLFGMLYKVNDQLVLTFSKENRAFAFWKYREYSDMLCIAWTAHSGTAMVECISLINGDVNAARELSNADDDLLPLRYDSDEIQFALDSLLERINDDTDAI